LSIRTLTLPGTNKDGFASVSDVRREVRARDLPGFLEIYPVSALLVADIKVGEPEGGGDPDATARSGPQLLTELKSGSSAFRYMDKVGFLAKRPGNPFPQFVSLGRAANNDLVIGIDSVSKFHGYFTIEAERWSLTDYRSTNGTEINGTKVTPNVAVDLADADRIRFGNDVIVMFLSPQALYAKLRR